MQRENELGPCNKCSSRDQSHLFRSSATITHLVAGPFDHDSRLGSLSNIFGDLQLHVRTWYASLDNQVIKVDFDFMRYLDNRVMGPSNDGDNYEQDVGATR